MAYLAPGKKRVWANAGVGSLRSCRWNDVPADLPQLDGWVAAGLVSLTGPRGEAPPEFLPQLCCGRR